MQKKIVQVKVEGLEDPANPESWILAQAVKKFEIDK